MNNEEIKNIQNCPVIVSCKELLLKSEISFISDPEIKKRVIDRLERVSIYRIEYRSNKNIVVGFLGYPKTAKNLPCIISLRGGSREFGMITTPFLVRDLSFFADQGYVVITTQYPGVDGGTGVDSFGGPEDLASIKSLKKILDWIPEADSSLVAMKGHSRGGLMTYMMLRDNPWIMAAIIGGAPTDEFRAGKERKDWRAHQVSMFGKSKEELLKRSPIKWVSDLPKKTPILIMHGASDWRVLPNHSILMSLELQKHQIPHKFILFEGADHGIMEFRKEYNDQTLDWLKKYLKKDRRLPDTKPHGE